MTHQSLIVFANSLYPGQQAKHGEVTKRQDQQMSRAAEEYRNEGNGQRCMFSIYIEWISDTLCLQYLKKIV